MDAFYIIWHIVILHIIWITEITVSHNMKIYEHKQSLVKDLYISIDS